MIGAPVDLKTWAAVGRNRTIMLLLLITTLQMSGQFVVFTFMGPLLTKLTQAGADGIGLAFLLYGVFGFIGIAIATRIPTSRRWPTRTASWWPPAATLSRTPTTGASTSF